MMDNIESLVALYTGLFSIQVTTLTLVAAGIIALFQIYEKQSPKRNFSVVVKPWFLVAYISIFLITVIASGLMAWSLIGHHDLIKAINLHSYQIAVSPHTSLAIIVSTTTLCLVFFYLLWRSRTLLNARQYLRDLANMTKIQSASDYLFHKYDQKPFYFRPYLFYVVDDDEARKEEEEKDLEASEEEHQIVLKAWEQRYAATAKTQDPFAPFVDYCLSNSSSPEDVERVGLPILEGLILRYLSEVTKVDKTLPRYIKDLNLDFRVAFTSSPINVQKRYLDLLKNVAMCHCKLGQYSSMSEVALNMFVFVKGSSVEDVKTYAVKLIKEITDTFKLQITGAEDWRDFDQPMSSLSLIVARIVEDNYHGLESLSPVSIIEHNHAESEDLSSEMANYFASYGNMHEAYPKIVPVLYFDAIDISAEAFAGAITRSNVVKENVGLSRYNYENICDTLYYIFFSYADAALRSGNGKLLGLSLSRLERGIKFTHKHGLNECVLNIADHLVNLGVKLACAHDIKMEYFNYSDTSTDLEYIASLINQYADEEGLLGRKSGIEHTLFEYIHKKDANDFKQMIGW